ncbi:helix-turn-helix domain-containing protein [Streptomyces coeruleorubidus]|uniref:helix-turn-helix domain-containing protein n=1 Tax=Streptomyces coeruleorubidus TaxID=116188 RepID=UPI00381E0928
MFPQVLAMRLGVEACESPVEKRGDGADPAVLVELDHVGSGGEGVAVAGVLVRRWRGRRRRSRLDVSHAVELPTRHLSCIETGRANPSRDMIRLLCDELDVPQRERNALYLAAGFAPVHPDGLSRRIRSRPPY